MKTKSKVMMVLLILMMVFVSDVFSQALNNEEIKSLKGLKSVFVIVEALSSDVEKDGLKQSQIKTEVELKLRMAGIKVQNEDEWFNEPWAPFLQVSVTPLKNEAISNYSYSFGVSLYQYVVLTSDTDIIIPAITWQSISLGIVGSRNVAIIRNLVEEKIDMFINDYLTANPK
ncbi:hypothetical protein ACFL6K_01245 [Candidatus Latescibacterota bacterium]